MDKTISLSVHQLVDFLLRRGDIDNRIYNNATMSEGAKIHSYYQHLQGVQYTSEYQLFEKFVINDFTISLDGRADGIICLDDKYIIDEIKSTIIDLNVFFEEQKDWHLGQAHCYALMFAHEKKLNNIGIQLTYIHQITNKKLIKKFDYEVEELEKIVNGYINDYLNFYNLVFDKIKRRNESADKLVFPYKSFRKGQYELAKKVYSIAKKGGILYCEAPTGIGKTISTLFPAIKAFALEQIDKIFYLTAKNSGKDSAFNSCHLMIEKGLFISDIVLTAKEKICLCPGKACNPDECPFAKQYYNKIFDVLIYALTSYQEFSPSLILEIAKKYEICPFELSLDISLYVDVIICDYNYYFDPIVYLKRYFDNNVSSSMILVDEAHNLIERNRSMFSATISNLNFIKAKNSMLALEHKKLKSATRALKKVFDKFADLEVGKEQCIEITDLSLNAIDNYLLASTDVNKYFHEFVTKEFTNFSLELLRFSRLIDYFDEYFCLYVIKDSNDIKINLLCLDPSEQIRRHLDKVHRKVIFSATMSPMPYYIKMTGGSEQSKPLMLPSPFPRENFCLLVAPNVSIKYKNRERTMPIVVEYIKKFIAGKIGNYFVYVPSYEYLNKIVPLLEDKEINLIVQEKEMSDADKTSFLSCFIDKPKKTTLAVAVVGGAFGEGIDLVSERLIGVIVVGVGFPQICFEKEKIREYFDEKSNNGYLYSYVNPGMNKVMQAVGRVIRSENDKGAALLIDDRYLTLTYQTLFKSEWSHYKVATCSNDVSKIINNFWKED